jgi:hypothetical protein
MEVTDADLQEGIRRFKHLPETIGVEGLDTGLEDLETVDRIRAVATRKVELVAEMKPNQEIDVPSLVIFALKEEFQKQLTASKKIKVFLPRYDILLQKLGIEKLKLERKRLRTPNVRRKILKYLGHLASRRMQPGTKIKVTEKLDRETAKELKELDVSTRNCTDVKKGKTYTVASIADGYGRITIEGFDEDITFPPTAFEPVSE